MTLNSYVSLEMVTGTSTAWNLVHKACPPPGGSGSGTVCSSATNYAGESRWYWHGKDEWKHVTVSLYNPSVSLSQYTRFRFTQVGKL